MYCGQPMGESYEAWLQISIDHVIPLQMQSASYPILWLKDIANCVTCCRPCNDFLQKRIDNPAPATLEEFFILRDQVFLQKLGAARSRHEIERTWFAERVAAPAADTEGWMDERIASLRAIVDQVLSAAPLAFDQHLSSTLPLAPGLYVVRHKASAPGQFLRAGVAEGAGGLRQRVYQNHLMGNQRGNLRNQLVRAGRVEDMEDAKAWIRQHCVVQAAIVDDPIARRWGEHFMLAVLQPEFSDRSIASTEPSRREP